MSFASVVKGADLFLPKVSIVLESKGGMVSIKINETIYEERLKICNNALIGRIILIGLIHVNPPELVSIMQFTP